MRVVVAGLGVQGRKRVAGAGADIVATVDPVAPEATHRSLDDVSDDTFDAALLCVPDDVKLDLIRGLVAREKHVLVEKPLLGKPADLAALREEVARRGVACYTAYNHRFEPAIEHVHEALRANRIGRAYLARLFYGNGTAADVHASPWRDQGLGVLSDLGSHLLDLALLLFGPTDAPMELWAADRFENRALDHVAFGAPNSDPVLEFEASLVSWRNTFTIDVFGSDGSIHLDGLRKWGGSRLVLRTRVLPSGVPSEESQDWAPPDASWKQEYEHFKVLCDQPGTNLENDIWIASTLQTLGTDLAASR